MYNIKIQELKRQTMACKSRIPGRTSVSSNYGGCRQGSSIVIPTNSRVRHKKSQHEMIRQNNEKRVATKKCSRMGRSNRPTFQQSF